MHCPVVLAFGSGIYLPILAEEKGMENVSRVRTGAIPSHAANETFKGLVAIDDARCASRVKMPAD